MSISDRGKWAEDMALDFLKSCGLKLKARNYHSSCGEIDLIMMDNNIVTFIEVKYRKNDKFVDAVETITRKKCKRIISTSQHYLQALRSSSKLACRFDVVTISGQTDKPEIEWIKNAFQA